MLYDTLISPTHSSLFSPSLVIVILAFIFCITSIIPVLVSFNPTFFKVILLFGTMAPATIKNAAEEISPGTVTFTGVNVSTGSIVTDKPSVLMFAPNALNIFSVWSLVFANSITVVLPCANNPANNMADFTCALFTGASYVIP